MSTEWCCPTCGAAITYHKQPAWCTCGTLSYADGRIVTQRTDLLGERIARGTKRLGIQPCAGCDKRRRLFNWTQVQLERLAKRS